MIRNRHISEREAIKRRGINGSIRIECKALIAGEVAFQPKIVAILGTNDDAKCTTVVKRNATEA